MMVAIFTSMVLALLAVRWGPRWFALATLIACLLLSLGEFLYEIDSPVDGFRMPWLQAMIHVTIPTGQPA